MKEFDFDELDKAVNSLMSTMPATQGTAPKTDDDVQTVTLPTIDEPTQDKLPTEDFELHNTTSLDDGAPKIDDTADETALTTTANDTTVEKKPMPTIAPRRSGRFMDMVHASGDPTKIKKAPSDLPSRVGRTVTPSGGAPIVDVMKPGTSDTLVPNRGYMGGSSASLSAPAEPTVPEDSVDEAPDVASENEDMSQMMSTHGSALTPLNPDTVPEELVHENDAPATEPEATGASSPAVEAPSSPFLPDAKVDKRPLGVAGTDELGASALSSDLVPAELSSDLMAIEAGESEVNTVQPPETTKPESTMPDPAKDEIVDSPKPPVLAATASPAPSLDSGPISIPQQYQEAPNSGDQSNGAIYDTASYHQPLAHPAKKKSGWWIVLIIVVIVLLGAGAGAFAYFQGYF